MIDLERICREAMEAAEHYAGEYGDECNDVPTVDKARAELRTALARLCNAVLEEAAKVVENMQSGPEEDWAIYDQAYPVHCAEEIRALRVPEKS